MQKRRPIGTGAVLLGGKERLRPTTRAIIRATPLMALRLEALKFGAWWAR